MLIANAQSVTLKAKLFYGFSDNSRLSVLEALRQGPLNVTQLTAITRLSQSNVSNHLSCLRDCGLVTRQQQGRFALYQLSDPRVGLLLQQADELLSDVAKGVYECTRYEKPEVDDDCC
ncbi:MAG TPA: metalloregulator ArsR/SmtB family transcription factor [Anaerolineales bacterium]|nr:metalloregulator ArsR/SmtB family transcription factor [Anaerolineales bacterium]HRQ92492.1 metalloregulator ArsR/SmtB family transcription factor [Anaerolineales bacterium]